MTESDDAGRKIKSVTSSLEMIGALRQNDGATLSELSNQVGLSPGTVHTHLATLADEGYVVKEGDIYTLGMRFMVLGEYVRNRSELYQNGKDEIDRLARETGECAHLIYEQMGAEISLYGEFGPNAVGEALYLKNRENRRRNLHSTASGKAILAHLEPERMRSIVEGSELEKLTPNTITSEETLFDDLDRIRQQGFALNDEEEFLGTRAVAAPILDTSHTVLGAISLSAPSSRLKGESFRTEIPEMIMESANIIELNMQANSANE